MEAFLPTEIARLVYGYLKEEECDQAAQIFLETSKHLVECLMVARKGRRFHTRVLGRNLVDILDLLSEVTCLVRAEVNKNVNVTPGQEFLNNLIHILGIDETEAKVSNTTNTVYLSISVPTQEENVKKKPSTSKSVEQTHEDNKLSKKANPSPNKLQPDKPNEEEDILFDLNMLNTLLDNTALHERLAENINKAILTGENVKQKGEDKKIIEAILNNTEADPIFEELVCDLAAPRAEDSTTPEDTEVEGGETGDENRTELASQDQLCSNQQKELLVEEQNDEAVRSILASRSVTPPSIGDSTIGSMGTGQEIPSMEVGTKSLVELAMEKAGVSDDRTVMDVYPLQDKSASVSLMGLQDTIGGDQVSPGQQLAMLGQQQAGLITPPPVAMAPAPPATSGQPLGPHYSLLQVLPSNFSTVYIQSVPSTPQTPGSRSVIPSVHQPQFAHSPQFTHNPIQLAAVTGSSSPRQTNIFTIDNPPPVVAPTLKPIRMKPPTQSEPPVMLSGTSSSTSITASVEPEKTLEVPTAEAVIPVIKRSGVRTRGGISKLRGRQKGSTLRAIVPKIKNINEDQIDIELVECTTEDNKVPNITKRCLRPRNNIKDKLEGSRSVSPSTNGAATDSSESSVIESKGKSGTVIETEAAVVTSATTIDTTNVQHTEIVSHKPQEETAVKTTEPENLDLEKTENKKLANNENKISDTEKDETPEQRITSNQNKKRLSLSTPRRGSHIRTLDFRTPVKKCLNPRKANTSPKTVPQKRLLQFQKSVRKVRRNKLFSGSPDKEGATRPWDADLRAVVGASNSNSAGVTADIPTSVGLKRKVSESGKGDDQRVTEECAIGEKNGNTNSIQGVKHSENAQSTVSGKGKDLVSCDNSDNTPDVSKELVENTLIEGLATSEEIVKHIEKEVLDVIGEEGLNNASNISLSPFKCKPSAGQVDKTFSDEIPSVIVVNEKSTGDVQYSESGHHSEKEVLKTTESSRAVFDLPKSLPNLLQTPAKIDFTGAVPKTPISLMTPISKIITEQVTILDGKKLLTPGFPPTPQGREAADPPIEVPSNTSCENKTPITVKEESLAKLIPEKLVESRNITKDGIARTDLSKGNKQTSMDKNTELGTLNHESTKRAKSSPESTKVNSAVEDNGQKQKTNKKTSLFQKNTPMTRSALTQKKSNETLLVKKTGNKKSLTKNHFENDAFIQQCLQTAKESLFGESDSESDSTSSSSESTPSPELSKPKKGKIITTRKTETQPRISDKLKQDERNNVIKKKNVNPSESKIKAPSFDVAMARFKNMSYLSESSSSDDSIFENTPPAQSLSVAKRKLKTSEEDASRDSFPRLYLSDDETNTENTTKIKNTQMEKDYRNVKDSVKFNEINENEPNTKTKNLIQAPLKQSENNLSKNCKVTHETWQKILSPSKNEPLAKQDSNNTKPYSQKDNTVNTQNVQSSSVIVNKTNNDYSFLKNYTESYTVISNETGQAVNRIFKVSPVISLYEHGLTKSPPKRTVSRVQKIGTCNIKNNTPEQIKSTLPRQTEQRYSDTDKMVKYSVRLDNQEESGRKIATYSSIDSSPNGKGHHYKSKISTKRPKRGDIVRERWKDHYRHRPRYKSSRMNRHSPDRYLRIGYDRNDDRERMIRDRGRVGPERRSIEGERSDERNGQKQWGRNSSRESSCDIESGYTDRNGKEISTENERSGDKMRSRKERSTERERGHREERSADKEKCGGDRCLDRGRGTRDWSGKYGVRDIIIEERRRSYYMGDEMRRTKFRGAKKSLSTRNKFRKDDETHLEESKTQERCKTQRNSERYSKTDDRSEDNACKILPVNVFSGVAAVSNSSREEEVTELPNLRLVNLDESSPLLRTSKIEKRFSARESENFSRGVKRKFIDEKEEGELSDSSSVQVNLDNTKNQSKEKRLCELENSHLEQQRNTLLKKLDLDHFLSIVHGSKD